MGHTGWVDRQRDRRKGSFQWQEEEGYCRDSAAAVHQEEHCKGWAAAESAGQVALAGGAVGRQGWWRRDQWDGDHSHRRDEQGRLEKR